MRERKTTEIKVGWSEGIAIATNRESIYFDPQKGKLARSVFISHAHGDHTMAFATKARKYSTIETKEIFAVGKRKKIENFQPVKYDEKIRLDDAEITVHNAGHMLGSAQFEIQTPEESIVYTGDINCRETLTTKPAKIIQCDTLIIESTYGHPSYVFPKREDVYMDIIKWTIKQIKRGKTPIFQVYASGKAQEIIRLINTFTSIPVVSHPTVTKVNVAHKEHGLSINFIDSEADEGRELLQKGQCTCVAPLYWVPTGKTQIAKATATGWAIRFRPSMSDIAFPLSSHADFTQLTNYIRQAKPRRVYTIYGFKENFANYISKKLGIKAQPILPLNQKKIGDYF